MVVGGRVLTNLISLLTALRRDHDLYSFSYVQCTLCIPPAMMYEVGLWSLFHSLVHRCTHTHHTHTTHTHTHTHTHTVSGTCKQFNTLCVHVVCMYTALCTLNFAILSPNTNTIVQLLCVQVYVCTYTYYYILCIHVYVPIRYARPSAP